MLVVDGGLALQNRRPLWGWRTIRYQYSFVTSLGSGVLCCGPVLGSFLNDFKNGLTLDGSVTCLLRRSELVKLAIWLQGTSRTGLIAD